MGVTARNFAGGMAIPGKEEWWNKFFKRKKIELTPQWQKDLQQDLAKGEGYGGKMTAPLSKYEKTGLEDWLAPYLEAPATGESFKLGEQELAKVLKGEYDPRTSPYYAGLKTESMTNLEDVIDQIRGQKAAGGEFFTSERIGEEQKAGKGVVENLNTMLGQMFEQERARTFAALPIALQYDQYAQTTAPLAKVSAATTFGALPRLIEQGDLERKYQDFVRTKNQQMKMAGMQIQPDVFAPSDFEKTISTIIGGIGAVRGGGSQQTPGTQDVESKIAGRSGGGSSGGFGGSSYDPDRFSLDVPKKSSGQYF